LSLIDKEKKRGKERLNDGKNRNGGLGLIYGSFGGNE
jgi:hypothetical protein